MQWFYPLNEYRQVNLPLNELCSISKNKPQCTPKRARLLAGGDRIVVTSLKKLNRATMLEASGAVALVECEIVS
jgi:hypothetical protein